MGSLSFRAVIVRLVCVSAVGVCSAGVAEAWPIRGPAARAERRAIRAQMSLERDLGRGRVIQLPGYAAYPGVQPLAGGELPLPPQPLAVPAAARQAAAQPQPMISPPAATAAAQQAREPQVARAAFEAQPEQPASSNQQAADGTVSVLVRPGAESAGSAVAQEPAAEPLRFPGASAQP